MRSLSALAFTALAAATLGACASDGDQAAIPAPAPRSAWVVGADGSAIGQAIFTEAPAGVLIRLEFSPGALPPGWHGLHIHGAGTCTDFADGFRASGAHQGHNEDTAHGLLNPEGPEPGDLPNLFAPPSGPFAAEVYSPWLTLGPVEKDKREPLLDADGAALVVHAGPDDHATQPIGGAGARIGCAAITNLP